MKIKKRRSEEELKKLYDTIPVGKNKAIPRSSLKHLWKMSDRHMRAAIAELREWDNGDKMIIVSSSHGCGYFRTEDLNEINRFYLEMKVRALKTFSPLKKVRRLLFDGGEMDLFQGWYA